MHLMHMRPRDVDEMTVRDFHIACDWIDEYVKANKG